MKPDTQLRVSPCFSSQTQPACPLPNSRIFRCEGISFIPRAKQRSPFLRLSPQEQQNYITFPHPASIAAPAKLALGVGHAATGRPLRLSYSAPVAHDQETRHFEVVSFLISRISSCESRFIRYPCLSPSWTARIRRSGRTVARQLRIASLSG